MTVNEVIQSMIDYLNDATDCGYTQKHIQRCAKILKSYSNSLLSLKKADDEKIKNLVKKAVIRLNKLNEATEYSLIETDQREDLAAFIEEKAIEAGVTETDGDITEEWREW